MTVNAITPTIGTFSSITKNYGDANFNLTAPSSNSAGAFSYRSSNTAVATISGNTVSITGVGTSTITATQAANGNYTGGNTTTTLTVGIALPDYVWTGNVSTDWSVAANWSNSHLPDQNTTGISIPATAASQPVLSTDITVYSIQLNGSISLNGHSFTIAEITGSGTFKGSATSSLTVNTGSAATLHFGLGINDNMLQNLTIQNIGTVSLASPLSIFGKLTVVDGTLNTNNLLTLKSIASGTAVVDQLITGKVVGKVTVERYIPSGYKAFREIGTGGVKPDVHNGTVFTNWQENGNRIPGYGSFVTGEACTSCKVNSFDNTTGLDYTYAGNPGLYNYTYNNWAKVTNTKTTVLNPFKGYHYMIYGDRTPNVYSTGYDKNPMMSTDVTIRTTGDLIQGNVDLSETGVIYQNNNDNSVKLIDIPGEGSFVSNPYPCAVDWNALNKSNLESTYYYFDPTYLTGGYQEFVGYSSQTNTNSNPLISKLTRYIQPGQAFWVQADNTPAGNGRHLGFSESNKVTSGFNAAVFKGGNPNRLIATIWKNDSTTNSLRNIDGAVAVFGSPFPKAVGAEDSKKFWNGLENITISEGNTDLCIDGLPNPQANDSIYLKLYQLTAGKLYTLRFDASDYSYATGTIPYLADKYKNTVIALQTDSTFINFTATTDTASYTSRFVIVFKTNTTLPVEFVSVKAKHSNNVNVITWSTSTEIAVKNYEVQRSTDGKEFMTITTVEAKNINNSNYAYNDANTVAKVYYRIKATASNAKVSYSNTVVVLNNETKAGIAAMPNPVENGVLNLQLNNIPKGNYSLVIVNSLGQTVMSKTIIVSDDNSLETIRLEGKTTTGVYTAKLLGTEYSTQLIIK